MRIIIASFLSFAEWLDTQGTWIQSFFMSLLGGLLFVALMALVFITG